MKGLEGKINHLVRWREVIKCKEQGGLGIENLTGDFHWSIVQTGIVLLEASLESTARFEPH